MARVAIEWPQRIEARLRGAYAIRVVYDPPTGLPSAGTAHRDLDVVHLLPRADLPDHRRPLDPPPVRLTVTLVREGDVCSLIGAKRYDAPWKDIESQRSIPPAECNKVRVPSATRYG
ncbi:hypothetical protein FXF50_12000 [Micromonospora sp. AP08]|nr:hypothetical protein FXF50_12000 [Micromonospora sp. AP08]